MVPTNYNNITLRHRRWTVLRGNKLYLEFRSLRNGATPTTILDFCYLSVHYCQYSCDNFQCQIFMRRWTSIFLGNGIHGHFSTWLNCCPHFNEFKYLLGNVHKCHLHFISQRSVHKNENWSAIPRGVNATINTRLSFPTQASIIISPSISPSTISLDCQSISTSNATRSSSLLYKESPYEKYAWNLIGKQCDWSRMSTKVTLEVKWTVKT